MTDNIFGDDFELDPDFDTKHINGGAKDKKLEAKEPEKPADLDSNTDQASDTSELEKELMNALDWSDDSVLGEQEKKGHVNGDELNVPIPELNSLLDEYGIDTEVKVTNVNDRMDKMRQRVEGHTPTARDEAAKKSPLVTFLWLIGCIILLGLIVVQYSIFNINDLVKNPKHKKELAKVCGILSCQLPNADLKAIQLSHIKHRPSQVKSASNNVDIMAAIINSSEKSQLYPNLKVTVYGTTGKLGDFVAQPKNYMKIEQTQLFSGQARLVMFTISIKNKNIKDIEIKPFY